MGSSYTTSDLLRYAQDKQRTSSDLTSRAGKILADANTIESYNVEEKGFIVCMISKVGCLIHLHPEQDTDIKKPKAAPPPATPAQPASTPAQPPAPQHQAALPTSNAPATPTPAQPTGPTFPGGTTFNDPSTMLMGNQNEATIREMEAMGFARGEIDRALRAAFFNPDRAIEYLLNGIPEHIQAEQRQRQQGGAQAATSPRPATGGTAPAAATQQATESTGDEPVNLFEAAAAAQGGNRGSGGGGGGGGAGAGAAAGLAGAAGQGGQMNMDFLRSSPHFQNLRQLVQQQPAMLEPILQQVAEGNPQLAQMIGQNQEQFLQLLAEVCLPFFVSNTPPNMS